MFAIEAGEWQKAKAGEESVFSHVPSAISQLFSSSMMDFNTGNCTGTGTLCLLIQAILLATENCFPWES